MQTDVFCSPDEQLLPLDLLSGIDDTLLEYPLMEAPLERTSDSENVAEVPLLPPLSPLNLESFMVDEPAIATHPNHNVDLIPSPPVLVENPLFTSLPDFNLPTFELPRFDFLLDEPLLANPPPLPLPELPKQGFFSERMVKYDSTLRQLEEKTLKIDRIDAPAPNSAMELTPCDAEVSERVDENVKRPYQRKQRFPGFANFGQLCEIQVPRVSNQILQNTGTHERLLVVFRLQFRLTEILPMEHAKRALLWVQKNQLAFAESRFPETEPLQSYLRWFFCKTRSTGTSENLLEQKDLPKYWASWLNPQQCTQLFDAFYWVEMQKSMQYVPVLEYYKGLGWSVKRKERYKKPPGFTRKRGGGVSAVASRKAALRPISSVPSKRGRKKTQHNQLSHDHVQKMQNLFSLPHCVS